MLLNERIKQLRKEHELSQAQLARKMHLTQGAISQWENGLTAPAAEQIVMLADVFGITADELLGREAQPDPIREETAALMAGLSPDELQQVLTYAEFLKSSRK